jgi:membrane protease subunit HflC
MAEFFTWIMNFLREFKLLTIIMPWERAARVRLGSRVALWEPGWHIKIPFIDEIVLLNTRLRVADAGSQTLTTRDGKVLTIRVAIGFRIEDPLKALLKMQSPEASCGAIAASTAAEVVSQADSSALRIADIETHIAEALQRETTYEFDFIRVRDFAYCRTYRLLNDNGYNVGVHLDERKV